MAYERNMVGIPQRKVTTIPADPSKELRKKNIFKTNLRVAPYCRVSTDSEEQLSSYHAQIEYYTAMIAEKPEWTMVDLYADEGLSGTSTKKRKRFNQMITDCKAGKIDLVITKSVSRFGRNTLDGLNNVRLLRSLGIGVYFEKENVNTLNMDNEMILTFFFSQAQAESESLSKNVVWGHRKNFQDGKVYYQYKSFLGYRKGADGSPEIDEDEASIVRRIFSRYLIGDSIKKIADDLTKDGIKTARGKDQWTPGAISHMLQNERYIGDAILQKTFVADLFSHKSVKNTGELPMYYVRDCHPAIIDRETFRKVQEEMARRKSKRKVSDKTKTLLGKYSGKYALSELLVCGECGRPYRRTTYMGTGEKRFVWRCISRLENGKRICKHSPTLDERCLHAAIMSAINEYVNAQEGKSALRESIKTAVAREMGGRSTVWLEQEILRLEERQLELFSLAANAGEDCTEYDDEIGRLNSLRLDMMKEKAKLEAEGSTDDEFLCRLTGIFDEIENIGGMLTEYDDVIVRKVIRVIRVIDKDTIRIVFADGTEITQRVTH